MGFLAILLSAVFQGFSDPFKVFGVALDYWQGYDLRNLVGVVFLDELYYLVDKPRLCLHYHQRLLCVLDFVFPPVVGRYGQEVYAGGESLFEEVLGEAICFVACGCGYEDYCVHM